MKLVPVLVLLLFYIKVNIEAHHGTTRSVDDPIITKIETCSAVVGSLVIGFDLGNPVLLGEFMKNRDNIDSYHTEQLRRYVKFSLKH